MKDAIYIGVVGILAVALIFTLNKDGTATSGIGKGINNVAANLFGSKLNG